jgi:hypothetical protein
MVRRLLCLGVLLTTLLGVTACGSETKPSPTQRTVPDPEGGAKPKDSGGRPG